VRPRPAANAPDVHGPRPEHAPDPDQVAAWLRLFVRPGQVVELRAIRRDGGVHRGYYDYEHLPAMARTAVELSQGGEFKGVYFTLNPVRTDLLARSPNRASRAAKGTTTADADVERRRWLLIDADRRMPGDVSAAEAEKARVAEKARAVRRHLSALGWPEPVLCDSGNGFHLLYAIDLPADDGGVVRGVLRALAGRFDDEHVTIDRKVYNPSRITKLYGTRACKGDDRPDRPHRWTRVVEAPAELRPATEGQLKALIPPPPLREPKQGVANAQAAAGFQKLGPPEIAGRARAYVATMPPAVSGKGGHNALFAVACELVLGFGLTKEEAWPILQEYNARCEPPWTEAELRHKLDDADAKPGPRGRRLDSGLSPPTTRAAGAAAERAAGGPYLGVVPDFLWVDERVVRPRHEKMRGPSRSTSGLRWLIHHAVMARRCNRVVVPDVLMAQAVWGAARRPDGWRRRINRQLLRWRSGNRPLLLDAAHAEKVRQERGCPPECPLHDGPARVRHGHYVLRVNPGLLGVLDQFGASIDGLRRYDFDPDFRKMPREPGADGKQLKKLRADRKAAWKRCVRVYFPAWLFGHARRVGLTSRRLQALHGVLRELTRPPRNMRSGRPDGAAVVLGAMVPDALGAQAIRCDLLDPRQEYVAFGGNGRVRRGKGYRIVGARGRGWLARCGYPPGEGADQTWASVRRFLADLAVLAETFGLAAAGLDPHSGRWRPLSELVGLTDSGSGRAWLHACHLRVYAPADYLAVWRGYFASKLGFSSIPGGPEAAPPPPPPVSPAASAADLSLHLRRIGMIQKDLAAALGMSAAEVSYRLSGRRPWTKRFQDRVEAWIQACR
jgi:hypothetical protein